MTVCRRRLDQRILVLVSRTVATRVVRRVYDSAPNPAVEASLAAKRVSAPDETHERLLDGVPRHVNIANNGLCDA